jgi:hypothetical protein
MKLLLLALAGLACASGMRINPDPIQSINQSMTDVGGDWLWSSDPVYDNTYSQVLTQPISLDVVTLSDIRWFTPSPILTIRQTSDSNSRVDWSGIAYLLPDPSGGGSAGVSSFAGRTGPVVPQRSDYAGYYLDSAHVAALIGDSLGAFAPTRTTNVIPKFNGSALVPSSWTDSSTQLRTTTTDTLIVQHAQMGDALGSSGLDVWWGYKGIINGYGGTSPGFIAGSVGQVEINVASGQGFVLSVGPGNLLVADVNGVWINGGFKSATDTITGLSVAGYVTNSANGALGTTPTIPYSALSGTVPTWNQNTTGSAAKWTTPRNITIGSSTQALDGTTALTYSLAAIGAQAALSGGTTNALAKWTGSSTLGTGSWTDSASVLRTTTTDTLVSQNATLGNVAYSPVWASQPFRVAKFGWIGNGGQADGAWMIDSIGNLYGNGKNRIELSINGGYDVATFTPTGSRFYGADTISLASKTILGTDGSGKIIDNSATTLANNTTGNAATATKWQTARNLTIGSSTQAQDGTAALTYSLAAIGAQPAGSYLPVNNPVFTGTLSGPTISASTTTYSPAYTGGTITLSGNVSASTANIGALAGTVVASSGSLSSLSGTNLVLGNGSTIPQSTFAPASGGNYLPLAGGSITSATGIQIPFNNSTTNTIGIGTAANFGSNNFELGVSIPSASSHWPFGIVKGGTALASIDNNGNFIATSATVGTAIIAQGTGTAISAPNGGISYNGPEIILDKIIIGGSSYTLSAPHAFVAFISTGTAVSMPAGSTDGQMMILSNSGTANILINNRVLSAFSLQTGTSRTMQWYAAGSEWF